MNKYVFESAKRCLQCENPQCQKGCPISTPIKEAIGLLLDGEISKAGKMLFENNPLSIICCHVCPQENQCEGHCVLGKAGLPVQFSAIEKYISDFFLYRYEPKKSNKSRGKVAVIGSGPSGLTVAFQLAQLNYDVTIFERHSHIGGVTWYGIPEFRLPREILRQIRQLALNSGITIRPNLTIGRNITIDTLLNDGYQAIFIGAGVWKPKKLNVPGESYGNVHYALDFLKKPSVYYGLGKTVAVIGAGNVAMDTARTAFRFGAEEVAIICRGDETEITAREVEKEYAVLDGAKFMFNKEIMEFNDDGVILKDRKTGKIEVLECDTSIIAIGQEPRNIIVSNTTGIETNEKGQVITNEYGMTTREGIFAGGDVVTGAKTVVEAVVSAKEIAKQIHTYIQKESE